MAQESHQGLDVSRRFGVRKILAILAGVGMVFGLVAIGFFNENAGLVLGGLPTRAYQLMVIGGMIVLAMVMVLFWRCPACGHFLALESNPVQCPRCRARLKAGKKN
jgi:ribosomal protein S27AE